MADSTYTKEQLDALSKMGGIRTLLANTRREIRGLDRQILRVKSRKDRLVAREAALTTQLEGLMTLLREASSG
jgi:hypothetical protein